MMTEQRRRDARPAWAGLWLWLGCGLVLAGCSVFQPIDYQADAVGACAGYDQAVAPTAFPLHDHLPLPIPELEQKLKTEPFTIVEAKSTGSGTTRAMRLHIQFQDCTVLQVKWRAATASLEAYNNNPRKELAAYAIQKLFLAPGDYVVPVTVLTCMPTAELAKIGASGKPQLAGLPCVLGTLSIWLNHVVHLTPPVDQARFERSVAKGEQVGYAQRLANLNLLTYLVSHRDGRKSNFLMSDIPDRPHLFAIDNGLAFSGIGNPRPFIPRWRHLKVDQLPRAAMTRLQHLSAEQLRRHLETVAELRDEPQGRPRSMASFTANPSPDDGVRRIEGGIQLGLTRREIERVDSRLRRLLERIEKGDVQLF